MDFILRQLDSRIAIQDQGSYAYVNLMRQRIEYVLFFSLAYLWDKQADEIDFQEFSRIIVKLNRMSIGTVVETIRRLDKNKEIFVNDTVNPDLNSYPNLRNEKHGHGYVSDGQGAMEFAQELERMYRVFVENIPLFRNNADYILVTKKEGDMLSGIRLPVEGNGLPVLWSCNEQVFNCQEPYIGRCFVLLETGEYVKLTPFIHLENDGDERYIFVSLEEKLTGKIKYAQLLKGSNQITKQWKELEEVFIVKSKFRRMSANSTIMNEFENNFKKYITTHEQNETQLRDFLLKDKSSVYCTIWGHGGVGKTALIQHIVTSFFNGKDKKFDYIVFASAKDRMYNTVTGKIEEIKNSIRSFEEVIYAISTTLFDMAEEYDQFVEQIDEYIDRIVNSESKSLIIIDDFETFNETEKKKIVSFIQKLNILSHKVVLTTRVRHGVMGHQFTTSEFDEEQSKAFLTKLMEVEYPSHAKQFEEVAKDQKKMNLIYKATDGRPIFLHQFAHLFVQFGFRNRDFDNLAKSENAKRFLYDRIYHYLSEKARNLFVYISQIINDDNLSFNYSILEYLAVKLDGRTDIMNEIEELGSMRIVVADSPTVYRVYSDDIVKMMNEHYLQRDESFRANVERLLQSLGETGIQGDIYELLLNNADKLRKVEQEETYLEAYRKILDDPKCPAAIKQKAIRNITGHLETTNQPLTAIQLFKTYHPIFRNDQDIIRLYARLLWNNDRRAEACVLLRDYFNGRKKYAPESMVLYFIWVEYQGKLILQRRRNEINEANDDEEKIAEIRQAHKVHLINFINELGFNLRNTIQAMPSQDLINDSLKQHHLTNAVLGVVKCGTELIILNDENYNRTDLTLDLMRYGLSHLQTRSHPTLRGCQHTIETERGMSVNELLKSMRFNKAPKTPKTKAPTLPKETPFQRFTRSYKPGDSAVFEITGVKQEHGVFGRVDKVTGIIHRSNVPAEYLEDLETYFPKGSTVQIRFDRIDEVKQRFTAKFESFEVSKAASDGENEVAVASEDADVGDGQE